MEYFVVFLNHSKFSIVCFFSKTCYLSGIIFPDFCLACDEVAKKRDIGITFPATATAAAAAAATAALTLRQSFLLRSISQ